MFLTTGTVARKLGKARETIWQDLRLLGITPARDSAGRMLLTEQEVERLAALYKERERRRKQRRRSKASAEGTQP
jgi:hypothetical protein